MPDVLMLTDGAGGAVDSLLEAAASVIAVGDRLVVAQDSSLSAADALGLPGVVGAVDDSAAAGIADQLGFLLDDPGAAAAVAGQLLGVDGSTLDGEAVQGVLAWLTSLTPEFATSSPPGDGEPWGFGESCLAPDGGGPGTVPPGSPLRAVRFAGDPVLEQCLAGTHRMRAPEEGRAVLRVQAALLDLGFALPVHGADGKFGAETGTAVTAFKQRNGIVPADPVVGPQTMARLDQLFA